MHLFHSNKSCLYMYKKLWVVNVSLSVADLHPVKIFFAHIETL